MGLAVDMRGRRGAEVVLTVEGELDYTTVDLLRRAVQDSLRARPRRLSLDLGQVTFIDSIGVGTLVAVRRSVVEVGCLFVIERVSEVVHRALTVTGVAAELGASQYR
jgi:anti-sigma B factor antagonist